MWGGFVLRPYACHNLLFSVVGPSSPYDVALIEDCDTEYDDQLIQ
jgi:hypothetical protein